MSDNDAIRLICNRYQGRCIVCNAPGTELPNGGIDELGKAPDVSIMGPGHFDRPPLTAARIIEARKAGRNIGIEPASLGCQVIDCDGVDPEDDPDAKIKNEAFANEIIDILGRDAIVGSFGSLRVESKGSYHIWAIRDLESVPEDRKRNRTKLQLDEDPEKVADERWDNAYVVTPYLAEIATALDNCDPNAKPAWDTLDDALVDIRERERESKRPRNKTARPPRGDSKLTPVPLAEMLERIGIDRLAPTHRDYYDNLKIVETRGRKIDWPKIVPAFDKKLRKRLQKEGVTALADGSFIPCPHPSCENWRQAFHFGEDDGRGVYYCFKCQRSGDYVTWLQDFDGLSEKDAMFEAYKDDPNWGKSKPETPLPDPPDRPEPPIDDLDDTPEAQRSKPRAKRRKHQPHPVSIASGIPISFSGAECKGHLEPEVNELAVAEAYSDSTEGNLRWNVERDEWWNFTPEKGWIRRLAQKVSTSIRKFIRNANPEPTNPKAIATFDNRGLGSRTVSNVSELTVIEGSQHFDQDDNLIGLPDCQVFDIRTGKVRKATREDFVSMQVTVSPKRGDMPRFTKFLCETFALDDGKPDWKTIHYLMRWFGYGLTGSTDEHIGLFFQGVPATAKSTMIDIYTLLLGKLAKAVPSRTFLKSHFDEHLTVQANLQGPRLVHFAETGENKRFNEELMNSVIAGDEIGARVIAGNPFNFRPHCKPHHGFQSPPTLLGARIRHHSQAEADPLQASSSQEEAHQGSCQVNRSTGRACHHAMASG